MAGSSDTFVAFDFETANSSRASACAIGIAVFEKGRLVHKLERLIRPEPNYFEPFNTHLHGISAVDVAHQPEFGELWSALEPLFAGSFAVAHNAGFDCSVLRASLIAAGLPFPVMRYLCSVRAAKKTWPDLESFRLDAVAAHIGFHFKHHNAMEDAVACGRILCEAMRVHGVPSIEALALKAQLGIGEMWADGCRPPRPRCAPRKRRRQIVGAACAR